MHNQKSNFSENNFENNQELDTLFKDALQNHRVPTEDHVWRRIRHGLEDKKKESEKTTTKRIAFPIWTAVSGIAASLLIWSVFFAPNFNQKQPTTSIQVAENTVKKDKVENTLSNKVNVAVSDDFQTAREKTQENTEEETTTLLKMASKQTRTNTPTIITHQAVQNQNMKMAVASLQKDKTKTPKPLKNIQVVQKSETESSKPSTLIAQNVWASDFVVHNTPMVSINSVSKSENDYKNIQVQTADNQMVAVTIRVGQNNINSENMADSQENYGDYENQNSQFGTARRVLKQVWNLKSGKKVDLQKILPNNENAEQQQAKQQNYQTNENFGD